jgi:D-glycero-beta-D-manno-heptose-7-phosphate kinase
MSSTARIHAIPSLAQLAQLFPKQRILVVGDLVADHYIYGQTDRVSREAPVLIVRYESSEVKLGGGANAAANARSLGGQVVAVGALGVDEMGHELRRRFKSAGIRLMALSSKRLETETKTRILAGGVNTTRQQMLRLDRGAASLQSRHRIEIARLTAEAARNADAVVVSDYGAGVVGEECRQVLRKLASDGLPVCVDSRFQLRSFSGVTVCKPNEPELESLVRRSLKTERDVVQAARSALKMLGCRALLVTRGRNGVAILDRDGRSELIPAYGPEEAVDVTGAGDTVIAAFTLALSAGANMLDAARIANVAAGLVVQKQGTATVARDELLRQLSRSKA